MNRSRSLPARMLRAFWHVLLAWLALSIGSVWLMRWIDPFSSAFMLREQTVAAITGDRTYRLQHQWVDADEIAANMQLAVIAAEDQKFPTHWGFDLASIDQALKNQKRSGRVRGASTLTQQVAKNLYLWPGRSWLRKGFEAYFTVLIETFWPKRRILEVYLNIAEFGKGVYGVDAASRKYFRKPPARLSAGEAALLAAVLPNPKRLRVNKPSGYVRARQSWIVRQMALLGGNPYLRSLD